MGANNGRTARSGPRLLWVAVAALVAGLGYGVWARLAPRPRPSAGPPRPVVARARFCECGRFGFWWGEVPAQVRRQAPGAGGYSNIEPEDVVGPARCGSCHTEQYQAWSQHPHRWMNAAAVPNWVKGDFRGQARFRYLGGEGRFWRAGDQFFMAAERGRLRREFRITRTIGSRYFEYYVGVQLTGPEPAGDPRYRTEHVLPFGYWLGQRQWVPTVHIREDRADDFDHPRLNPYEDFYFRDYDASCARCHTTLPLGDWLCRVPGEAGRYTPQPFSLDLTGYLRRQRPELLEIPPERVTNPELERLLRDLADNRPPARIRHLGVVCEACHLGGKPHADDPEHTPPHFFPTSPLIYAQLPQDNPYGRTHDNVNWVCGRCHIGDRPQFPGGMSTWNSAEYSDALRGSCYSKLRCIDCHEPHRPTGQTWSHSPDHDDSLCLKCHDSYRAAAARQAHTRHPAGSDGDRCLNCHMPRTNEGLDTVVRTHTILSPTRPEPIEQNGPNACNLCHLDRSINWTLGHLRDWYRRRYDEAAIDRHYPSRQEPVGPLWLRHPFRATRLVAAAAYGRQKRRGASPEPALLGILDDPYLLNRQFGQLAVEAVYGRSLETLGYQFTLGPQERAKVLPKVRAELLRAKGRRQ